MVLQTYYVNCAKNTLYMKANYMKFAYLHIISATIVCKYVWLTSLLDQLL